MKSFAFGLLFMSFSVLAKPSHDDINRYHHVIKRDKPYIEQQLSKSRALITHIVQQLEQLSLPVSLALIPMIESSYNNRAVSVAKAAGLWQLMPATARRFGLEVSATNDQRFDVHLSTGAALKYLSFLYKKFNGDLSLTVAAYNAGEGRVSSAIKKAQSSQFHKLRLPQETSQYVTRFYAYINEYDMKKMFSDEFLLMFLFHDEGSDHAKALIDLDQNQALIKL